MTHPKMLHIMTLMISLIAFISYFFIDLPLAQHLQQSLSPVDVAIAKKIALLGYALYPLLGLGIAYLAARAANKHELARILGFLWLAIACSGLLCDVFKVLLSRARPSVWFANHDYGFYFFKLTSRYWSFPSGHSTTVAALFVGIWLVVRQYSGLWLLVIACVALSRLATQHHYLSDIMMGCLLGSLISIWLHNRLILNRTEL